MTTRVDIYSPTADRLPGAFTLAFHSQDDPTFMHHTAMRYLTRSIYSNWHAKFSFSIKSNILETRIGSQM